MRRGLRMLASTACIAGLALVSACGGSEEGARSTLGATSAGGEKSSPMRACGQQLAVPGFRCGSIEVPYERADPGLGKIRIGFAVRERDRADAPSRGTIFAVEGGPGYASSGTANAYTKLFGRLLRDRDLVLVDMRGTGRSQPVDCPNVQHGTGPDWLTLSQCARSLGPRFISYRTAAGADDIDAVRAALGIERISLYGDSYGTYLAQSYAFRHGEHLKSLVLDSAYPARGESAWYPSLPRTGIRSLQIACDRSPDCSGDTTRLLRRLIAYLKQTRRGAGDLIDALFDAGYGPPATYLSIIHAGRKLLHGDPHPWRRLTRDDKQGFGNLRGYAHPQELLVSCNDYPMIWDKGASEAERRAQLEQAIRSYPNRFRPFTPRQVAISSKIGYLYCLTFPRPTDLYQPPVPKGAQAPKAPVLVVSGELDSVTTPHEGRVVAGEFPNSHRDLVRNVGHVDALYHEHGKAARKMRYFLLRHG